MVGVLIDICRKHGMAPFVSLRLNDVHQQENFGEKNQNSRYSCRFYTEHPEYLIDPEHKKVKGYYKKRGQNWIYPEVRDYKLSLLKELAWKYDLDGIELDFLRDNTLFRTEETTEEQRVDIITEFVAQVRSALDNDYPSERKRFLCVRIPLEIRAHSDIGLSIERLVQAGVDMFNLSGWYHTIQRTDIPEVRKRAPDAGIYLEMTHSTASHRYFEKEHEYSTYGDPRTSDYQFYTTAYLAQKKGADGMSLFNFVYYRMGEKSDIPVCEPPFHVLPRLRDMDWLSRKPQYYMLAKTAYFAQLPRKVKPGKREIFELNLASAEVWREAGARLRLHTEHPLSKERRLAAKIGGHVLEETPDESRFYGNPFDGMISPEENRRAWAFPVSILRDGLNSLEVTLAAGPEINIIYIDLFIPGK